MALVRFIDGQQRGKTATVDDAAISGEGRYRFKKREITKTGGRTYYLKPFRRSAGSTRRSRSGRLPSMTIGRTNSLG